MSVPNESTGLLTLEEYQKVSPRDYLTELVRGRIVKRAPLPRVEQFYCWKIANILLAFVQEHRLGHIFGQDREIVTEHDPDSVRVPDMAYYSFGRFPEGEMPSGFWSAPDLVVEFKSPSDRWPKIHAKASEYLEAGVTTVLAVDLSSETIHVYSAERSIDVLHLNDTLTLPDVLHGFSVPVRQVFV